MSRGKKRLKARDKITVKMSRGGLVTRNETTGEAKLESKREQEVDLRGGLIKPDLPIKQQSGKRDAAHGKSERSMSGQPDPASGRKRRSRRRQRAAIQEKETAFKVRTTKVNGQSTGLPQPQSASPNENLPIPVTPQRYSQLGNTFQNPPPAQSVFADEAKNLTDDLIIKPANTAPVENRFQHDRASKIKNREPPRGENNQPGLWESTNAQPPEASPLQTRSPRLQFNDDTKTPDQMPMQKRNPMQRYKSFRQLSQAFETNADQGNMAARTESGRTEKDPSQSPRQTPSQKPNPTQRYKNFRQFPNAGETGAYPDNMTAHTDNSKEEQDVLLRPKREERRFI